MGSGKGSPEYWVAVIKPGRVMFEMAGVAEPVAREALRLAMHKLPVKCKFVKKSDMAQPEEKIVPAEGAQEPASVIAEAAEPADIIPKTSEKDG